MPPSPVLGACRALCICRGRAGGEEIARDAHVHVHTWGPPGARTPSSDDLVTQSRFEPHGRERVGMISGSPPPASSSSPFSSSPRVLQNSSEKMR